MVETTPELPRKVAVFSGHMIDAPGRETPRFPPEKEPVAANAIALRARGPRYRADDLAICGLACGGDLLFAESSIARSARLELYIPFDDPSFLENRSTPLAATGAPAFSGRRRARRCTSCRLRGPDPGGRGPVRTQQCLDARGGSRFGPDKVDSVCLWNGERGDGPGGAQHMMEEVQRAGRPGALARHEEALGSTARLNGRRAKGRETMPQPICFMI